LKNIVAITFIFLTSCISHSGKEILVVYDESKLKEFVLNLRSIHGNAVSQKQDSILNSASKDSAVFRQTISFLETPLSNPNSAYRNQDLYLKLLQAKISSDWYSVDERAKASERIRLLQQNNIGHPANDFTYLTPAGYKKQVYGIKSPYTLLYFYNPECNACREMKMALLSSPVINNKIATKQLAILAIYTDNDEKLWLDHLNEMPSTWLQGRDQNEYLYRNNIYDLRAIPTLYLLDASKKVLLKDVTSLSQIEPYFKF
jgi:hypothetical protein